MQKKSRVDTRRSLVLSLTFLGLAAALVIVPYQFRSAAGKQDKTASGLNPVTRSHEEGLENYDIRADKSAYQKIAQFRQSTNKSAAAIADLRESFVRGEELLKAKVPTLKVEYNSDIRIPELIAPDVKQGRAFLTSASNASRAEILRSFAKENQNLIGVSGAQADDLKVTADYTNPDGNLSFAELEQNINGIPVFRGEIKAGFTKSGEMIRVVNNLAPGLDYGAVSADFGSPLDAVKAAAGYINYDSAALKTEQNAAASSDLKAVFGTGDSATTAEKMYFPTEPGVARAAWRVLIWEPVNAYYVIVDAETGAMLWRKNITEDQTQSSKFTVYRNANAMIDVADNPFPLTPGPTAPNGVQGAAISRTTMTRIGNEGVYSFNNNGWITDGDTKTDGNAVQAGLDRDGVDGVDTNSEAVSAARDFTYTFTPFNPNTNTGDAPVAVPQTYPGSQFQQGSITQLFYITNWYHDEMYRLGFTEQAKNFQANNFGRGGVEADRVRGEGQDSSGTNNANFSTPADGGRGRMQMYVWTAPNPDIDGNFDADVVIHEFTHGLSNRLHGNGSGLSSNMSRGMGEGWSDFYAHSLLSEPTDPINGIYTTGSYDTYLLSGVGTNNYYYGIRRFPKAVLAFTGGPNNRPHNPLTFADIDGSQINLSDGAYSPAFVGTADQVHNAGEVWSTTLWEVRAKYVARLGWEVGNRRMLQFVTDGMKLAPLGPTFLQERDAIISAAQASLPAPQASADVADLWEGFRLRGMGYSAAITNAGSGTGNARVTQAFDAPNLEQRTGITVSDGGGNNNGYPEPGETISINVTLTNNTGTNATGTTAQIVGGGTSDFGTVVNNSSVTRAVAYTVPSGAACGSFLNLTINVNSSLGATSFTRTIIIGVPTVTFTEGFDTVTAPNFPTDWTAVSVNGGVNFVTTTSTPSSAPNSAFAANPETTVGGGTDLTSPALPITAQAGLLSFRHKFATEAGWDGGALEISVGSGAFQDIVTAGGRFVENGYNGTLGAGTNNPLANRAAWTGDSAGYITTTVQLPATAAGQSIRLKWRFGADDNTGVTGWNVDDIKVFGSYSCGSVVPTIKSRADFDGDGRTDLSVFRPTDGNWYLQRSSAGFSAVNWGLSSDTLVPGDYDGDGKADTAVRRNGDWLVLRSSNNTFSSVNWGLASDTPMLGDYDGDGKADQAVYRSSNATWYINKSSGGTQFTAWGQAGDVPVAGDFDGDGKTDLTVYRSGQWLTAKSSGGTSFTTFGTSGDRLVPADYDGDNKDDVAVFRPSNGTWYALRSSNGSLLASAFGQSGDVPVPGDYDGDGRDDQAVYRNGTWYLNRSTSGFGSQSFGAASDRTIPAQYIP